MNRFHWGWAPLLAALCLPAIAAGDEEAAVTRQYRQQVAACAAHGGEQRLACLDEATLDRTIALEDLHAQAENTPQARIRAARNKVAAAYALAEAQCARGAAALRGACRTQAGAQRDAALADIAHNQMAFVSYDALAAGGDDGSLRRAALACGKLRESERERCEKQLAHRQAL
ncbi:hypothetical protein [Chitiniphilus shinanonensis]|uniref:hypothetical protein n=1 Tax=Chitiniphilus shinanonensis TaxID=553088 RepID=UPI003062A2F8